ncbi:MAG: kelch repeat-containing protein, partial [Acidobacteriota bacterium]
GSATETAHLARARRRHTATLLDGASDRVLVFGGLGVDGQALASAETFDGATWSQPVLAPIGRYDHTATLLAEGRVLMAGGVGTGGEILDEVQLYDPVDRTFETLAPMTVERSEHAAVTLHSGRILVIGGRNASGALAQVERFDPISRRWSTVAPMAQARALHSATLLPSGKVLVAGGEPAAAAELYDPTTDSWAPTLEQPKRRSGRQTATLLPSGEVLVFGQPGDTVSIAEVYEPATDSWDLVEAGFSRESHTATLLPSGEVLIIGGYSSFVIDAGGGGSNALDAIHPSAERYALDVERSRRPTIACTDTLLDYGTDPGTAILGSQLRGDSETSGGTRASSASDLPTILLQAIEGGQLARLRADQVLPEAVGGDICAAAESRLRIEEIPAIYGRGWHLLSVVTSGVTSEARLVRFDCDHIEIVGQPQDRSGALGARVTFAVDARGGRNFQWRKCLGDDVTCTADGPGWVEIAGADQATYTTPPIVGPESGTRYHVSIDNGCVAEPIVTESARLEVFDTDRPQARVTTPSGGEYWPLSTDQGIRSERVGFDVSDPSTWICELRVTLIYSNDGGETWAEVAPGPEWPRTFGPGAGCLFDQAVASGSFSTALPHEDFPPSGQPGSLYKIRLDATDHAGNTVDAVSPNPFFIVEPNDDSIKTLILAHPERQGIDCGAADEPDLCRKLRELADHPRVAGLVVDLGLDEALGDLYDAWDHADARARMIDSSPAERAGANAAANDVLFGASGLQSKLAGLLSVYEEVQTVMLIGGDSIIPMARVPDRSGLLQESTYTDGPDLDREQTTVARAIAEDKYLSDDPLVALLDP